MKKKEKDNSPIPEIDESNLTPEQKEDLHPPFQWGMLIFILVVLGLLIACMIVVFVLKSQIGS